MDVQLGRVTYDHLLPLHKTLVTIVFTNLPSLHPHSFHEMIFILVYLTLGYNTYIGVKLGHFPDREVTADIRIEYKKGSGVSPEYLVTEVVDSSSSA